MLTLGLGAGAAAQEVAPRTQDGLVERDRAQSTAPLTLADVPLVPRAVLFGNPERIAPRISPDGRWLSYLAPVDGVMNVWVAPIGDVAAARPITRDNNRGVRIYFWSHTNEHVLYLQDKGGDENWRVYATRISDGETRDLTPFDGVAAQIQGVSHKRPGEILVGLNNRAPQFHDLHIVDIATGEMRLLQENPGVIGRGMVQGFVTDNEYEVRFVSVMNTDDGSASVLRADPESESGWTEYLSAPMEDTLTTSPVGFDDSGMILYMIDSRGRNTAALVSINLENDNRRVIAADDRSDVAGVLTHPVTGKPQGVMFNYTMPEWRLLDMSVTEDFRRLEALDPGRLSVVSRTLADDHWIVQFSHDTGPTRYYHWDRTAREASFLFAARTDLDGYTFSPMRPVVIRSRDGLDLVSYLTLPPGREPGRTARPEPRLPLVLLVHGGPWARDSWGFNPTHQMLANRGYAVLSVNFRGSTGFGKDFINAGNREWAGAMHDDLIDAVEWAIGEGFADRDRVAIMGGSYGGYATLVGLTFTPEVFACGVDIVGPSNIITLLETIPPYWAPAVRMFKDRVGDHTTPEGRAFLKERSPLTHVDNIQRPLLIAQGANDPRVKQSESDQIVEAMTSRGIPVTYVLYPDEGHGFARPENRLSFYAVTDAFLSEHLGGRHEPISSEEVAESTMTVPSGAADVPGLAELLPAR
ncbi:MAG: S9 family peptidase [Phycisphaerales bacterium]|nr:MAG: S9 family peptidase [Phycisphaerales bacterium]